MSNPQEQERFFVGKSLESISPTTGVEGETKSGVENSLYRYRSKINSLLEKSPELKILVNICKDYGRDLDRFILGILENALFQISNGKSLDDIAYNLEEYFVEDDEKMKFSPEKRINGTHWFDFLSKAFGDLPKH